MTTEAVTMMNWKTTIRSQCRTHMNLLYEHADVYTDRLRRVNGKFMRAWRYNATNTHLILYKSSIRRCDPVTPQSITM